MSLQVKVNRIERISYDYEQKTLRIRHADRELLYHHVPLFLYHELLMAEKPAHYIRKHIHFYFKLEERVPTASGVDNKPTPVR